MCNSWSCIVTIDGTVWVHESIISPAKLTDDTADKDKLLFARVEITPPNGDVFEQDLKKWTLKIDEQIKPTWWTDKNEKDCFEALAKHVVEHIFIDKEFDVIENKKGLYLKNTKINKIVNVEIGEMRETSQVGIFSPNVKYKIMDNGLAIVQYKDTIEIICSKKSKTKLIKK